MYATIILLITYGQVLLGPVKALIKLEPNVLNLSNEVFYE